jgi:hypothetical protein
VLDFTKGRAVTFSVSAMGNKIAVAEYGNKLATDGTNARKVYLSEDDGLTFREIYDTGGVYGSHPHKVIFDTFTSDLWISQGDDENAKMYKLSSPYNSPVLISSEHQPTSAVLHKDYILFGQDNPTYGVLRYNRTTGIIDHPFVLDGTNADLAIFALCCVGDYAYAGTIDTLYVSKAPFDTWEVMDTITYGVNNWGKLFPFNGYLYGFKHFKESTPPVWRVKHKVG